MSFGRPKYFFGEAFRSLFRNRLMTVASILTVASCLLVVSVFYSLATNIELFLQTLERNIGITVFIYDDVDSDGVNRLNTQIRNIDHVFSVRYVTREEALDTMISLFEDQIILEGITADIFPRAFNIELENLRYHDEIVASLEAIAHMGIEHISQDHNIARALVTISNMVNWVSWVLILILASVSIIIITNTIRITVNARQAEINIMKYVGATDWFIRWPFLIEGILIGVIGAIIPIIIIWSGYGQVIRMVQEGLPLIEFIEFRAGHEIFFVLFPMLIALGALIGAIGSVTSIRKHLHV